MFSVLELMVMGLSRSISGLFSTPGFVVSPMGERESGGRKKKKVRREKGNRKRKEGRKGGREEGRKEGMEGGRKEGRIKKIRGKIRRRNFNKNYNKI